MLRRQTSSLMTHSTRLASPPVTRIALLGPQRQLGFMQWPQRLATQAAASAQGIPQYWTGEWLNVWRSDYAAEHFDVPRDDPRSRSVFFE